MLATSCQMNDLGYISQFLGIVNIRDKTRGRMKE